ncbi:MAG: prolyl 4-hydroxylase subunit alpha [Alteromonadaceae bacterium]|nr:MAG: prolyl 4-hydroxylase subunit alpha [Alteromonadaceae bacterium]
MTKSIDEKIDQIDRGHLTNELNSKGYILISNFFSELQCQQFIDQYDNPKGYRKTVNMERYRFGLGEYKYFDYPLPDIIQTLRERIYPKLVPVANSWMMMLKLEKKFPALFKDLQAECRLSNQLKPTPLILKYGQGGFNTLHQDLYGDIYFPLQAAIFLNEPDVDYKGGEFVLMQQVPRAQSKAIVLKPKKGDMIIFTTNFRPIRSARGYSRANMKHGVSEVTSGSRHALGLIFHDAMS